MRAIAIPFVGLFLLAACATPERAMPVQAAMPDGKYCRAYRLVVEADGTHKSVCTKMANLPADGPAAGNQQGQKREGAP